MNLLMLRKTLRPAVSVAFLCIVAPIAFSHLVTGCSGAASDGKTELDAPGIAALAATGWNLLKMNAYNYADTQLDTFGHFKTVPNGCHQDAAGAVNVDLWN